MRSAGRAFLETWRIAVVAGLGFSCGCAGGDGGSAGTNAGGASSASSVGKPAGTEEAKTDPGAEARQVLALCFERWKLAKDWIPDDPSNARKIHFTRPATGNPMSNAVLKYTIGTPTVKEGKDAGEGTTDPDKVLRRYEFPVTYTPNDTGSKKEYQVTSEWWVLKLVGDANSAWVVNQVKAERMP